MRRLILFGFAVLSLNAASETGAWKTWNELKAKREKLEGVHQEFEFTRTSKMPSDTQSAKFQIVLDMVGSFWKEKFVSGSGNRVTIFDGTNQFRMEEGGDEYLLVKRKPKDPDPVPGPYLPYDVDWSKSKEIERRSCGLPDRNDQCVILEVELKPVSRTTGSGEVSRMSKGFSRISIDVENGLVMGLRTIQLFEGRTSYQSDLSFATTRLQIGRNTDANLFKFPSEAREVKELSRWNAAKIKKQLAGKPAPDLNVTDIGGKHVALSSFKGKTVLLDFWTTWCPPCRADAPALDKLYKKYGQGELMIVGISVSEDRTIVEKFLKDHPHSFPVVLTTENELPVAYQIGTFPTYIVIEKDGTVASAVEGDQGFADLRKLLKKAGLEVE